MKVQFRDRPDPETGEIYELWCEGSSKSYYEIEPSRISTDRESRRKADTLFLGTTWGSNHPHLIYDVNGRRIV